MRIAAASLQETSEPQGSIPTSSHNVLQVLQSSMEATGLLTSSPVMVTGPPLADCCTFDPETVPAAGNGRAQSEKQQASWQGGQQELGGMPHWSHTASCQNQLSSQLLGYASASLLPLTSPIASLAVPTHAS